MNYLLLNKDNAQQFLESYALKEHIPSLSFIYESDDKYIGVSIHSNQISRKIFESLDEGTNWVESEYSTHLTESISNFPRLKEWMTIQNLMDPDAVADLTKYYGQRRYALYKGENVNAKLRSTVYDSYNDTMTFIFDTPATMKDHEAGYQPDIIDPMQNFAQVHNPNQRYTMMIQVLDFMTWLKDTRPEGLGKITWREIKDVLEVAYVKIWCNCCSYTMQGKNYRAEQFEASLYPIGIPDTKMRKIYGTYDLLCKHLSNLLKPQSIRFLLNPMASSCMKTLRSQGLI